MRVFVGLLFIGFFVTTGCAQVCDESLPLNERLACENALPPTLPEASVFNVPRIPSHYAICTEYVALATEEERFDCAVDTFWHGFSDGRLVVREEAEQVLSAVISLNSSSNDNVSLAKLYNLRGDLRMAMALENGKVEYVLFSDQFVSADLREALRVNPGYEPAQAFLDTMDVVLGIIANDWENVIPLGQQSLDRIRGLKGVDPHMYTGAAFSVSGTYLGYPLATGIPQQTVAVMEDAGCPNTLFWCQGNTENAPFAMPGLNYHFAEMHARVGNRDKTIEYLNKTVVSDGFEEWAYRSYADEALADIDAYLEKWQLFGEYKSPMMSLYANGNVGCSFCHTRQ